MPLCPLIKSEWICILILNSWVIVLNIWACYKCVLIMSKIPRQMSHNGDFVKSSQHYPIFTHERIEGHIQILYISINDKCLECQPILLHQRHSS